MDVALDSGFASELLERITEIQLVLDPALPGAGRGWRLFRRRLRRSEGADHLPGDLAAAVQATAGAAVRSFPRARAAGHPALGWTDPENHPRPDRDRADGAQPGAAGGAGARLAGRRTSGAGWRSMAASPPRRCCRAGRRQQVREAVAACRKAAGAGREPGCCWRLRTG